MLSRIAASRRHFTHRSDGNRKQLKAAERASEREKERSSVRTLDRYIPPESLSAFTLPTSSLRWWCDHKPERVWWWWCCVCVCACVRVCVCCCCGGLDCADGVFFVTSLNPAAHYLGLCLCTFLSAVGAVRSITSHGNLLQHADCSCTDRRVCVSVSVVCLCVYKARRFQENSIF